MPHHAVKHFGDFDVSLIVNGDNLARRTVLALVVRDLPDVLRELVNRQARAGVDRLPLHCATGG